MINWNEKFPKFLVLSQIFPILRAPAPSPKILGGETRNITYNAPWESIAPVRTILHVDACKSKASFINAQ